MYGKPPPLPPPIPNEPPSSFHPPLPPYQPPPPQSESIPSNSVPLSQMIQMRPPFPPASGFPGYVGPSYQPLQYPIPYNAQKLQYGGDYSGTFSQARPPQPSFVPPRPPPIRPLMPPQFDQPSPQFNQNNQPLPQFNQNNQPPPQFNQNKQPQPLSQFIHNKQSTHTPQLDDHHRQFDHNQPSSQLHSVETRRLPFYQLPSGH